MVPVTTAAAAGMGAAVAMVIVLILMAPLMILAIATYILFSIGLYTIAKNRQIQAPWLAWLPVGRDWLIGCVADHYKQVRHGEKTNLRVLLLIGSVLVFLSGMLYCAVATVAVVFTMLPTAIALILSVVQVVVWIGYLVVVLIYSIFYYKGLYHLYQSCNPRRAVLYLLLTIFVFGAAVIPFIERKHMRGLDLEQG